MLNYLWGFMIFIGIIVGVLGGNVAGIGNAAIDSSKEAVTLCIAMLGVMSMWTGLMQVAKKSGLVTSFTKALRPVIRFLFPDIPKDHIVNEYIASNMIANILGLGWAATPMGLMAMRELKKLNQNSNTASCDMCTLLIVNISSLQLIPVNIIAYRSQYGSVNPAEIILPGIIATSVSTLAGVIFATVARKLSRYK
ncbi:MAG: nucleoside recognition protein [Clostridiales bacterium]|nr:nucleoside recognition protein [Clostridiales bacterium]